MALLKKVGQVYEDPQGLASWASPYLVIDDQPEFSKHSNSCLIVYKVFSSKEAREAEKTTKDGKGCVESGETRVDGTDFTTWFSDSVLKEAGKNLWTQAYNYLEQHPDFSTTWEGDEQ